MTVRPAQSRVMPSAPMMILPMWFAVRVVVAVMVRGSAVAETGTARTATPTINNARIDRVTFAPFNIEFSTPPAMGSRLKSMKIVRIIRDEKQA